MAGSRATQPAESGERDVCACWVEARPGRAERFAVVGAILAFLDFLSLQFLFSTQLRRRIGWLQPIDLVVIEANVWINSVIIYLLASPRYLAAAFCIVALMLLNRGSGLNIYRGLAFTGLGLSLHHLFVLFVPAAMIVAYWPDRRTKLLNVGKGSRVADHQKVDQ